MFRLSGQVARVATRLSPITCAHGQERLLNLHEFQSLQIMRENGVAAPSGYVATDVKTAVKAAEKIMGSASNVDGKVVVKAQIHAGGRGLGKILLQDAGKWTGLEVLDGGVHMCEEMERVEYVSTRMLGNNLRTKQTGPEGKRVETLFVVEPTSGIKKEMYFAIFLDRKTGGPCLVGSPMGGMNIEDVAASQPEQIFTEVVDILEGLQDVQVERMAKNLGFTDAALPAAEIQIRNLYDLFIKADATQVEINPLVETDKAQAQCLDAKLNFDDNASFRQQQIFGMRDTSQEDPREVAAAAFDINYIGLDGNIACMVNGAGLSMATMDIIKLKGGEPANFLDLGGGASERTVTEAFKIINSDPKVDAILINIFGGIMRCDVIAAGIVNAAKQVGLEKPLVIRLEGTNVKEGKRLIDESSGLHAIAAEDLDDAAMKAVQVAKINSLAQQANFPLKVSFEIPL